MRSLKWFALGVGLAVLVAASVEAAERGGRRGRGREPEQSQFDLIVGECKLTDDQQTALKAKVKAKDDALAAWNTANAEKIKAAEDAVQAARSGTDADAKKQAGAATRALNTERAAATADADAAILTVLTAEQKAKWQAFQLYQNVMRRFRKVELTAEQTAKVKAICAVAWKELSALEGDADDKTARKERSAIDGKLRWAIENVILTAEQRASVATPPRGRKAAAGGTTTGQPADK